MEYATMTRFQLEAQIARITGEPLNRVRRQGFSLMAEDHDPADDEEVRLVLDCPFCRQPVRYPGPTTNGSEAMAECDRCDVYFGFDTSEVYAAAAPKPSTMTRRWIR
jgi:hypothetical protein